MLTDPELDALTGLLTAERMNMAPSPNLVIPQSLVDAGYVVKGRHTAPRLTDEGREALRGHDGS